MRAILGLISPAFQLRLETSGVAVSDGYAERNPSAVGETTVTFAQIALAFAGIPPLPAAINVLISLLPNGSLAPPIPDRVSTILNGSVVVVRSPPSSEKKPNTSTMRSTDPSGS